MSWLSHIIPHAFTDRRAGEAESAVAKKSQRVDTAIYGLRKSIQRQKEAVDEVADAVVNHLTIGGPHGNA